MHLDRPGAEVQMRGYLLVRQTPCNKAKNRALSRRKTDCGRSRNSFGDRRRSRGGISLQASHLQHCSKAVVPFNGFVHQRYRTDQVTVKSRRFRQYCLIPGPGFIVPVFLRYDTDDLAADRQIHAVSVIGVESRSRNNAGNGENAVLSLMPEAQKLSVLCICQGMITFKIRHDSADPESKTLEYYNVICAQLKERLSEASIPAPALPAKHADHRG